MLTRVCFAAMALVALSTPALAAGQCTAAPVAPSFPAPDSVLALPQADARAKLTSMNSDVKLYLTQRNDYSTCLSTAMDADKRAAQNTSDKQKLKEINDDYATDVKAFNDVQAEGVDVGNAWNKLATAYCAKDPDFCKKGS